MTTGSTKASFIRPAERIASFKPYFFASLNQKITALKAGGMDIIRLDMGSPDLPPADFIIDALVRSGPPARHPRLHPDGRHAGIQASLRRILPAAL